MELTTARRVILTSKYVTDPGDVKNAKTFKSYLTFVLERPPYRDYMAGGGEEHAYAVDS